MCRMSDWTTIWGGPSFNNSQTECILRSWLYNRKAFVSKRKPLTNCLIDTVDLIHTECTTPRLRLIPCFFTMCTETKFIDGFISAWPSKPVSVFQANFDFVFSWVVYFFFFLFDIIIYKPNSKGFWKWSVQCCFLAGALNCSERRPKMHSACISPRMTVRS